VNGYGMATATKPARGRKTGPLTSDWKGAVERAFEEAHGDVLKENERLKRLGIIDENGNLLQQPRPTGTRSGDFGGWG
jgi:hypothetical protein